MSRYDDALKHAKKEAEEIREHYAKEAWPDGVRDVEYSVYVGDAEELVAALPDELKEFTFREAMETGLQQREYSRYITHHANLAYQSMVRDALGELTSVDVEEEMDTA